MNSKRGHFIGLGVQRSGTSWVYACLYEHPEVCAPDKELNFFSRRRYEKGIDWYSRQFGNCERYTMTGEISVSYISTPGTAKRIYEHFPEAKLFVIFRDPVERAYSQYLNMIKTGKLSKDISFENAIRNDGSFITQGMYYTNLLEYSELFPNENLKIMIYEDSLKNPEEYITSLYKFLGINHEFKSDFLHEKVNVKRMSRFVFIDMVMIAISTFLRRIGFHRVVHAVKKTNIPNMIRGFNSEEIDKSCPQEMRDKLAPLFKEEAEQLGEMIDRDLVGQWNL